MEKLDPDHEILDSTIIFAIVMATYYRKSGSTYNYLKRCLESITKQQHKNWVIYLIGDQYENEEEFDSYKNLVEPGKLKIYNKPDPERNYISNKNKLWYIAGASAMNCGLEWARNDGYKYYAHIDDDDYWENNHLLLLASVYQKYPSCVFAYTKSTNVNPKILPREEIETISPNNLLPRNSNLIHASASFRCDIIPFNYHTTHIESEVRWPADAIMWDEINNFIKTNSNYCAILVPVITCHHDQECAS